MIRSLRFRLVLLTSLSVAFVLAMLGAALDFYVRQSAEAEFNQALLTKAHAIAATAEQRGDKIIFDYAPAEFPRFAASEHPDYFQARIDSGRVLRSPSLGNSDLPQPAVRKDVSYSDVMLPDGRPGRMISMSFNTTIEEYAGGDSSSSESPHTILLSVATDTISLNRNLEDFRWILIGLCLLAVFLSGAILFWVVGRGVRPVERLAAVIDQMGESDLSVRLNAPDAPTELAPVVDKLNGLLSRLDAAFSREKAFTADVAHELRNPLAALLTTFDVCRARPRDEAAYVAAIDKCRAVAGQMQAMVETLLILTRADSGQLSFTLKSIDFSDLIDDCWALFLRRAEARRLSVEWSVPSAVFVETDPEKLRIILHNIFDNAVSYADDGGKLKVAAEVKNDRLVIEIGNSGSRISPDKIRQLFDRFWRGDQSRTDTGLHCGLGLSLCQRLARLLNAQINIESTAGNWFIVRLSLPASAARGRPDAAATSQPISQMKLPPVAQPATAESGAASS
jgi:signal transduction histidine kinase